MTIRQIAMLLVATVLCGCSPVAGPTSRTTAPQPTPEPAPTPVAKEEPPAEEPPAPTKPHRIATKMRFEELREWLKIQRLNDADGGDNGPTEDALSKVDEWPEIASHIRKLFNTQNITDVTLRPVSDAVRIRFKLTFDQMEDLTSDQLLKHLETIASDKRGGK